MGNDTTGFKSREDVNRLLKIGKLSVFNATALGCYFTGGKELGERRGNL